jgi:SAM-dependent methyltransferase
MSGPEPTQHVFVLCFAEAESREIMAQFVTDFGTVSTPTADGRLDAPAFHRNWQPIWSVLAGFLQNKTGDVLEVGSGTGQHVVEFARKAPSITWWPSDPNENHLRSIAAWRHNTKLANLRPPARIDLCDPDWGLRPGLRPPPELLGIFCANVLHIAPWRVAEGLFAGAARHLRADGRMFVYGPFMRNGKHTAPSNAAFDASLRNANAEWGVRDAGDVAALAARNGLRMIEIVAMPANNFILIFAREPSPAAHS